MGGSSSICRKPSLSTIQSAQTSPKQVILPHRFMHYDGLVELGRFPRYPDDSQLTFLLKDIDRETSFFVFVSHTWLRSTSDSIDYDGQPHPDNASGEKYYLCVEGLEKIWQRLAKDFEHCFLWFDFSCLDQNIGPSSELVDFQSIMKVCDCVFTPDM
jgi:hypothetical protein